jgi:hypothetical protein
MEAFSGTYLTCQQSLGKTAKVGHEWELRPQGPAENFQVHLTIILCEGASTRPLSFVFVCMFIFRFVEDFLYWRPSLKSHSTLCFLLGMSHSTAVMTGKLVLLDVTKEL